MSQADFERFRGQVLQNLALQKQLQEVGDRDAFVRLVVKLGKDHGYSFEIEEVTFAMQASRRAWIERGLG